MFQILRSSRIPLADQLVQGLTTLIESGRFAEGARLPSIRFLARRSGVSPFTVGVAYERLLARGLIESRRGSGYFVAPFRSPHPPVAVELGPPLLADLSVRFTHSALDGRDIVVPAGAGFLPSSWLTEAIPAAALSRSARVAAATPAPAQGDGILRELIAERMHIGGVAAAPRNIVVTAGASQAFDLIARRLLAPDDPVLVDDPGYFVLPTQLKARGIRLVAVPRCADGPDLGALEEAARLHRPRMFFTQTLLHNPMGTNASPANCHAVLSLAERFGFLVVEDHAYTDFAGSPQVSLAQIDELRRVLYVGSFTKILSPGMRMGFVAAPEALVAPLVEGKILSVLSGSSLVEAVLRSVLASGTYRKHVQRVRERLSRTWSIASQELERAGLTMEHPHGGSMFLWARLPAGLDAEVLWEKARESGILLAAGPMFSITGGCREYLRFNIAYATEPKLSEFLQEHCTIDTRLTGCR
jgi:DNA-binding transcriptional MocR family regulator